MLAKQRKVVTHAPPILGSEWMEQDGADPLHWKLRLCEVYAVHHNPDKGFVGRYDQRIYGNVYAGPQAAANDLLRQLKANGITP